jgi:zinc protease
MKRHGRGGIGVAAFVALMLVVGSKAGGTQSVVLENGIEVIAEEMRVSPLVAVSVLYKVGSRNEVSGKTGVSHFVEHMIFNGTERYPGDMAAKEILKNGGIPNGETYWDYTHYGGVLPADKVDIVLDIEADRMAHTTVDSQAVEDERDIILEELAMRGEAPLLILLEDLFATAFKIHPYHHWLAGGYFGDVEIMDPAYVRHFYETYYQPANTVITIVGDIDEGEAIAKARAHFEGIAAGPAPSQEVPTEPHQQGLRRVTVRGDATEGRIMIFFKGPAYVSRDFEVGTVISMLLGGGRSSILSQRIVDTGIATELGAVLIPTMDPFGFLILSSVKQGRDLKACERAIYDAIEVFKTAPPERDLVNRAKSRIAGLTIMGRQTVRARALELAIAAANGDWRYADDVLENIQSVTPEEIHAAANKYFDWEKSTIGWLIPNESQLGAADLIGMAPQKLPACGIMAGLGEMGAPAAGAVSLADAIYHRLPNGLTLILKEDHALPVVALKAHVIAGSAYEPDGKSGIARLTAKTVAMGSVDYPYDHLYERIEALGSTISADTDLERAYLETSVLAAHREEACDIICDLLSDPAFRSKDFDRAKRELLSEITQTEEDAADLGLIRFREHFFAGHPYSRPAGGTRTEAKGLNARDVRRFYQETWVPEATVIAVVGDFDTDQMKQALEGRLAGWTGKRKSAVGVEAPSAVAGFSRFIETLPEKRQVKIFWGMKGPAMKDPRFEAFQVMNFIFAGGAFGSRLFDRIREKESLAYVVHSAFDQTSQPGALYIHLGTRPRNVEKATDAVREEIDSMITSEVTDDEMELTKNFLQSVLPFTMQTYAQIAEQLLTIAFHDLPHDHFDTFPDRIAEVTKQDVLQAARTYLDPDNSCMVIVGAVDENLKPVRPTAKGAYGR